jgi:glycosyltransferase involved in cell wall biosynthesis
VEILFLTLSQIISDISKRGVYPDLMRKFAKEGHNVYITCPFERRLKRATGLSSNGNVSILGVKTFNITKSNVIEKGIGTLLIDYQYQKAIKRHLSDINFDLVIYSTPPITFNSVILSIKKKFGSKSYLLLKDIFPQNAVDLGLFSRKSPFYWFFREKEKKLYSLSDFIGCMSQANVEYVLKHNSNISKEHVEVCPNSIELQTEKKYVDKESILSKYGIPPDMPILVYGGNIGKPQGIDFLIEVLKSNVNRSDVFFLITGSGTEYHKLDAFNKRWKPNNMLLLSEISQTDYDQLVHICDVGLIFLDKRFTIPNYPSRLLSYLENKIPVLMATDRISDIGTFAEEHGYGLWVESGDLELFNKKLNYLLSNKELLVTMGENGYQYLLKNYTVDIAYKTIISHFS